MLKDASCMLVSSRRIQIKPLTNVFTITIPLVNQIHNCCQEYVLLCNTHVYMFAYNSCNSCIQLMTQRIHNADIKFYRGILEIVVLFRYDKYLKYTQDIVISWRVISLSPHDVTYVSNMRAHSIWVLPGSKRRIHPATAVTARNIKMKFEIQTSNILGVILQQIL
jgi:hypothetical protein